MSQIIDILYMKNIRRGDIILEMILISNYTVWSNLIVIQTKKYSLTKNYVKLVEIGTRDLLSR